MRFQSYFNTALQLIGSYNGETPLAHYLKSYFAQHKKHGSKDRKFISHVCYCYYRLGHAFIEMPSAERLKTAIFLCNDTVTEWAVLFNKDWLTAHSPELDKRIEFLHSMFGFTAAQIFPWQGLLSEGIDIELFAKSHLIQPNLFLRIRPGKKDAVVSKLNGNAIPYYEIGDACIALPNNSQADKILSLNNEAVVQDYSSQQIETFLRFIQLQTINFKLQTNIWDCCAASGGKSLLAFDTFENVNLTVSDIRPSIIHNLQQRFYEAGIKNYTSFVTDLSFSSFTIHDSPFDLILCDAPCTGSGTWGRTPEQLYFFTPDKIAGYGALQQKIVSNVMPHLKKGGYFLYITCSVFAGENERCMEHIEKSGLKLIKKAVLAGYDKKADTMFACLFQN